MPTSLISTIKRMYPKPTVAYNHNIGTDYCVLGALFKYAREHRPRKYTSYVQTECDTRSVTEEQKDRLFRTFPSSYDAKGLLRKFNAKLTAQEAGDIAIKIVLANDAGNFTEAWKLLGQALKGAR